MLESRVLYNTVSKLVDFINTQELPDKLHQLNELMLSKKDSDRIAYRLVEQDVRSLESVRDMLRDFLNINNLLCTGKYDNAVLEIVNDVGIKFNEAYRGGIESKN